MITGEQFYAYCVSPIGLIELGGTAGALTSLAFVERRRGTVSTPLLEDVAGQLGEYLAGVRRAFDVPIDLRGTEFQRRVWAQLLDIPYGQTASYGQVANAIGRPRAARAVGAANRQNPIAIIVPCHRVIGSDGRLIGYGGGLWRKEWLLKHEGCLT